jgi:peptide chain release factor 1
MNERLDSMLRRYDEVQKLIEDPELVRDQHKYRDTMREYSQLSAVAEAAEEAETLREQLEGAKTLAQNEKDPDMKELA